MAMTMTVRLGTVLIRVFMVVVGTMAVEMIVVQRLMSML
jgi:hypothetical protein